MVITYQVLIKISDLNRSIDQYQQGSVVQEEYDRLL